MAGCLYMSIVAALYPPFRLRSAAATMRPVLPSNMECVGALAWRPDNPLPLEDGGLGDVGMISFCLVNGNLTIDDILAWVYSCVFVALAHALSVLQARIVVCDVQMREDYI